VASRPPPGRQAPRQDRARTAAVVHQGGGCAEASSAASLGRRSELAFRACGEAAAVRAHWWRPWRLPPGHGSQEPLGSRPAPAPEGQHQACLRVSVALGGPGLAGRHGSPSGCCRRCAPAGGDGRLQPQPPRHLFQPARRPTTAASAGLRRRPPLTGNLARAGPQKQRSGPRAAGCDGRPEPLAGVAVAVKPGPPRQRSSCAGNRSVTTCSSTAARPSAQA